MTKSLIILGRQPALGLAELESLYGAGKITPVGQAAALVDLEPKQIDFSRLGGTVKFCKLLTILDTTDWPKIQKYLEDNVVPHVGYLPEGKMKLGLSVYGLGVRVQQINATALSLKKIIKASGRSIRVIPNKEPVLNSAQVLHNQLTGALGWELILVRDGQKAYLAQNIAEQDIEAYAARDQGRPKRDARIGMLPPKLAQIIINLAVGNVSNEPISVSCGDEVQGNGEQRTEPYNEYREGAAKPVTQQFAPSTSGVISSANEQAGATRKAILDPFCGTGVLLQEALLMGYEAYGTDLDARMVEYAKTNLEWLSKNFTVPNVSWQIEAGDAMQTDWPHRFDVVASETYLGRALSSAPSETDLKTIISDCNYIHKRFLINLAKQTKSGLRLCLAIPAWPVRGTIKHLPILDSLTDMGYNRVSFVHASRDDLVYHREGQIVARELIVLKRI